MRWRHLAFLHWRVRPEALRGRLPEGLELETYDGSAWLGITPFLMTDVRARLMPALPGLSSFPELNVRTYVTAEGKPGIWFLSLDAANPLAVRVARRLYHLPYRRAEMSIEVEDDGSVEYASRRTEGDEAARFEGRYRAAGSVLHAEPGTLDHWLTERYCLYAASRKRLYRGEIHHAPWPLQPGEAEIRTHTMAQAAGIDLEGRPPLVHVARSLDVVGWMLEEVRPSGR